MLEPASTLSSGYLCFMCTSDELDTLVDECQMKFRANKTAGEVRWHAVDFCFNVKTALDCTYLYMNGKGYLKESRRGLDIDSCLCIFRPTLEYSQYFEDFSRNRGKSKYLTTNIEYDFAIEEMMAMAVIYFKPLRYAADRRELESRDGVCRLFGHFYDVARYGFDFGSSMDIKGFETAQLIEMTTATFMLEEIESNSNFKPVLEGIKKFRYDHDDQDYASVIEVLIKVASRNRDDSPIRSKKLKRSLEIDAVTCPWEELRAAQASSQWRSDSTKSITIASTAGQSIVEHSFFG